MTNSDSLYCDLVGKHVYVSCGNGRYYGHWSTSLGVWRSNSGVLGLYFSRGPLKMHTSDWRALIHIGPRRFHHTRALRTES